MTATHFDQFDLILTWQTVQIIQLWKNLKFWKENSQNVCFLGTLPRDAEGSSLANPSQGWGTLLLQIHQD